MRSALLNRARVSTWRARVIDIATAFVLGAASGIGLAIGLSGGLTP